MLAQRAVLHEPKSLKAAPNIALIGCTAGFLSMDDGWMGMGAWSSWKEDRGCGDGGAVLFFGKERGSNMGTGKRGNVGGINGTWPV
jgi:hypothetical protein